MKYFISMFDFIEMLIGQAFGQKNSDSTFVYFFVLFFSNVWKFLVL